MNLLRREFLEDMAEDLYRNKNENVDFEIPCPTLIKGGESVQKYNVKKNILSIQEALGWKQERLGGIYLLLQGKLDW